MTGKSGVPTGPYAMMQHHLNAASQTNLHREKTPQERIEHLTRLHPDYIDVLSVGEIDYKTRLRTDQDFANKFNQMEPRNCSMEYVSHENSVDGVAWLQGSDQFASTSHDGLVKIWDAKTGDDVKTLKGPGFGFYHCAAAADGSLLATCVGDRKDNLLIWNTKKWNSPVSIPTHKNLVFRCAFARDYMQTSYMLASVDRDGMVAVHDLAGKKMETPLYSRATHMGPALDASFCYENSNLLVSAGHDGSLHWVDMRDARQVNYMTAPSVRANYVSMVPYNRLKNAHGKGNAVYGVEWLDEHTMLSCGGDYIIKRFDLRKAGFNVIADDMTDTQFLGHTSGVRSMAVCQNKRTLVTGCEDGSVRVWDLQAEPGFTEQPYYHERLACRLAVGSQFALLGHKQHVTSISLRPTDTGGIDVLSGSWDQTCLKFELSAGDLDRNVTRHRSPTRSRKQEKDFTPY